MNELLDIHELVQENKRQESSRLTVFEETLKRCHSLIKRYNKDRIRDMTYRIPAWIHGMPKYDMDILRDYLVHHLRDNGLKVDVLSRDQLYVSWKETDIDLAKYMHRKTIIDNRRSSLYNIDQCPTSVGPPMGRKGKIDELSRQRMDMMKFRQNKQREMQQEREARLRLQETSRVPVDCNYMEFMNRY